MGALIIQTPIGFVLLAVLVVFWVGAEFRSGIAWRLISGAFLAAFGAYAAYHLGWLGPLYTISYYDWAIRRSLGALNSGRPDIVQQSFAEYVSQPKPDPNIINLRLEKSGFRP